MSRPQNDTSPIRTRQSNANPSPKPTPGCAQLTGAGRSAIAVIEVWGADASDSLEKLFRPARDRPVLPGQVRYGVWIGHQPDNCPPVSDTGVSETSTPDASISGESIVVTATSRQRYEIHCHGGNAAIRRIIQDLSQLGFPEVPATPGSGLPKVGNESEDRLISEACEVLTRCTTAETAAIVLDQVRGALKQWRDDSMETLHQDAGQSARIARQAAEIAAAGRIGVRLTRPFDVVLAGPPNVGKSSLINAMVGYDRSITMDVAGTTRDVLDAETVIEGWPIRLRDTAGLHSSDHSLERQGIDRAVAAIRSADLIVQVAQPGVAVDAEKFGLAISRLGRAVPVVQVLNKSDLAQNNGSDAIKTVAIKTVATTGQGIPELLQTIATALQIDTPDRGSPVPINARQLSRVNELAGLADHPRAMRDVLQRT